MHIQSLVGTLDTLFRYQEYPDFIVDILQACDPSSKERYAAAYLQKTSGLLLCYGTEVNSLYTATFPSDDLIEQLSRFGAANALLIIKHPLDWEEHGRGFVPLSSRLEQELKGRAISVYCAHAAHDNFEIASPSRTFVVALDLEPQTTLRDGQGRIFGYVAELERPVAYRQFRSRLTQTFGLERLQERYAHDAIRRVALIAGGGDNQDWLRSAEDIGCDTYVTGILHFRGSAYARAHNPSFIEALQATPLNAFGISHYLSERQGSIALARIVAQHCALPATFLAEAQKEAEIREQWGCIL